MPELILKPRHDRFRVTEMEDILNILCLEADRLNVERVREILTKDGITFRLIQVDTKEDFKSVLIESPVDIIFADYSLPSFHGLAAFEIARDLHPEIPFIFVSEKIGEDLAVETIKRGASDYVLKQRLNYLVPALRRALNVAEERQKRISAEDALRKSEEKFRTLVETTADWVWEMDLKGVYTYASRNVLDIMGYKKEAVIGEIVFDFVSDDEKEKALTMLEKHNRAPKPFRGVEFDHVHKNGGRVSIEISGVPVFNEDGKHSGWRGFNRDITERNQSEKEIRKAHDELEIRIQERTAELINAVEKLGQEVEMRRLAEQALRESQEQYRDLVETISDVIWEVNTEGLYTYVGPGAGDILGCGSDELIGRTFFEHMPPKEAKRIYDLFKEKRTEKSPIDLIEIKTEDANGSVVFLESSSKPFFDAHGKLRGYRGAYRNITERKRIEAAMKKSEAELRHLSSRLLSVHENESKRIGAELHDGIAQTVSAIKMRTEVALIQQGREDNLELKKSLESIIDIAQGAVEEIRRISRNLRPSMLDNLGILPTVSWLCREFETTYPMIRIEEHIEIQEEDVSDALKTVIFRIFQESLNNIAKHSQADLVRLFLRRADGEIEMTIHDNGTGFDLEKVLNETRSDRGLGLSSMRERTELTNGTFSVESREAAGTTVRAIWPVN